MQYMKNFTQIGVIVIIFLAIGAVTKEKEDGALGFLLVKPISRTVFLLSKLAAQFFVLLASTLCAFLMSSF
jgi:ABC-type transport system involved in multi-copper enzyme maturation permease subunit